MIGSPLRPFQRHSHRDHAAGLDSAYRSSSGNRSVFKTDHE